MAHRPQVLRIDPEAREVSFIDTQADDGGLPVAGRGERSALPLRNLVRHTRREGVGWPVWPWPLPPVPLPAALAPCPRGVSVWVPCQPSTGGTMSSLADHKWRGAQLDRAQTAPAASLGWDRSCEPRSIPQSFRSLGGQAGRVSDACTFCQHAGQPQPPRSASLRSANPDATPLLRRRGGVLAEDGAPQRLGGKRGEGSVARGQATAWVLWRGDSWAQGCSWSRGGTGARYHSKIGRPATQGTANGFQNAPLEPAPCTWPPAHTDSSKGDTFTRIGVVPCWHERPPLAPCCARSVRGI